MNTDEQQKITEAVQRKAEREKMARWDVAYTPEGASAPSVKPRRMTPRQVRAKSLTDRAKENALRLANRDAAEGEAA